MDKSLLRLNLQLFATTMTTETGSLSAEMKTFYEKRLLDQAEPLLVHNQFGDKYPIPANKGQHRTNPEKIQQSHCICDIIGTWINR